MPALYLTEQGATLRKTGDRLIVEKEKKQLLELECFKISTVFLFGGVHVTTDAMTKMLSRGISLVLLTRDGRLKGRLVPPVAKNSPLRLAQYERHLDPVFSLELAKEHISAKVAGTRELLMRHARNHPELEIKPHTNEMAQLLARIPKVKSLPTLLGVEGASARAYYQGFQKCLRRDMGFSGRRRRPPTDPVNAMLSLGYVMLNSEIMAQLEGIGFDPHLGFYHRPAYGRPSLALDVLEEFRVIVDQLVLRLVNMGIVDEKDFESTPVDEDHAADGEETRSVRLRRDSFKLFLQEYGLHFEGTVTELTAGKSVSIRSLIRTQCHRLAGHIQDRETYQACMVRP
ncbi:MAG: CRISPR-associated endonuclease Cas1 [Actinobacteria bacterium]|nr:CRISPR-associated endonuclease Cas1 [Actinomycetota bacterium]